MDEDTALSFSREPPLERARLEAGLADGDKTLPGEEYGEREEAPVCICPEDDKELLLLSAGDLDLECPLGTPELLLLLG